MSPNVHSASRFRVGACVLMAPSLLILACNGGIIGDEGSVTPGSGGSGAGGAPGTPSDGVAPTTRVARLTHRQYDNTVRELFGITDSPAEGFAPDALNGFGFQTSIDFRVDGRLGPQYRAAAEELAERAVDDSAVFDRLVPCTPSEASCSSTFVARFGERAFRRPLSAAQTTRYNALFARGAELVASGDAFRDGVRLVVEAMLQAPQFLYRTELSAEPGPGGFIALDGWEIASRLSYLLWDSMPDDALFDAARAGNLATPAQVRTAAERLRGDERAAKNSVDFHAQAWKFDRYSNISPDFEVYPDAPSDIVDRVQAASNRFVEEVIESGGGLEELLSAPYAYADAELSPLYGTTAPSTLSRIEFDASERKGILMQIGFLASNAYSIRTDPIHRGLFVIRNLLCRTIPDPPPGASQTPLPTTSEPLITTRQQVSVLTGQSGCSNCHSQINPPGFAFENFDAVGQLRTEEDGEPVDTSGQMTIDGETLTFTGAPELVDALAQSQEARTCYAGKWLEFAFGRKLAGTDETSQLALAAPDLSVEELVLRITQTRPFLERAPNPVGN